MQEYKSYKCTFQVVPKGTGSLAKLTIEYEKLSDDVPAPDKYITLMVNVTKGIDELIAKAKQDGCIFYCLNNISMCVTMFWVQISSL